MAPTVSAGKRSQQVELSSSKSKRVSENADHPCDIDDDSSENSSNDLSYLDDFEDEFEQEEVIDCADEDDMAPVDSHENEETSVRAATGSSSAKAPSVFRPGVDQLDEDHVLEPEPGTYTMLHKMDVQWPCLSFDVLNCDLSSKQGGKLKFPLTAYVVSGTQADRPEKNKIVVMKWSNLQRTNKDGLDDEEAATVNYRNEDDIDDNESVSSNDEDPELEFRMVKHNGGVNRIRAMPQMSSLVSTWSDNGTVSIFNIKEELESVDRKIGAPKGGNSSALLQTFNGHSTEGYALAWNPFQVGQMVSGDCAGESYLWTPDQAGGWTQNIISTTSSHFGSIEDVEFKRTGDNAPNVFALCGSSRGSNSGKTALMDTRNPGKIASVWDTTESGDTNVLAWNPVVGQLLLTGGDDGAFKVWDVRATSRGALANFKWHKQAITSLDWHPTDEAVLAVSSADDSTSIWDMSVEEDYSVGSEVPAGAEYFPPQLLFLHMGQKSVKEIKFHKQYPGVVVSTAYDGFNVFKTFNV